MSNQDDSAHSSTPATPPGRRPQRLSGERLRLRVPRGDEPAPSLREVARWLGYMGLRNGPHATWERPLGGSKLGKRLESARARLATTIPPKSGSQRVEAIEVGNDNDRIDDDDESQVG